MLRALTLPATLSRVLDPLRSCFTAPSFETFTALVAGLVAQPVERTVCGMLTGAGLARVWHHCRAHRFFSAARWCPRQVGLVLAGLVVAHLLPAGAPITVAVDDTLFRRRGKKVHGAGWFHDGSAAGQAKLGYGNNWIVVAIVVTLPFGTRPVALPVLATLAVKGSGRSKPDLARDLVDALAERFPDRAIHVVCDSAYGCGAFAGLGPDMTMTTRARSNAAFCEPAPPRTGKRGRPRLKGERIGTPGDIARRATWKTVTVTRYGTTATVQLTERRCLWYGTWRTDTVRVILLRDTRRTSGYDLALVTTDLTATPEEIIARYAARWSIEVTFFDAREHPRGRASPQPGHQGRAAHRPLRVVLPQPAHHLVHPPRPPQHRRRTPPGPPRRGTGRTGHPGHAHQPSAARSSPPDFSHHPPDQPQPKKSWKSSKPGPSPPHNRESRVNQLRVATAG